MLKYSLFDEINNSIKGNWKRVKCAILYLSWRHDPKEAIILKTGWNDADFTQFREKAEKCTADFEWDWYNHVWETDGSWWGYEDRETYDGLPQWTHHPLPDIPAECQGEVEK